MKKIFGFFVAFITIICLPVTAFMSSLNYDDEPTMLDPHHIRGAFIWHDNDGFHLRTTSISNEEHVFTGTIHTNGYFKDVNDRFFRGKDFYHLTDRDTIDFQFTTDGRTVGLDYDVADGDFLAVEIYIDGHKISPMDIYVGKDGWHPNNYKFTLDRPTYYRDDQQRPVVIIHEGWWYGHWGPGWHHRW
jgi:hypothetical protein